MNLAGLNWKRRLLLVSVPAVLLVAGGSVAASAVTSPTSTLAVEPAAATETAEPTAAAEKAETPEVAGAVDAGHQDPAGAQTDHQFNGEE